MTTKFKQMSQELVKLCGKTKKVRTRKQARDLSLKKWEAIRKMSGIFFGEFKVRCGFCGYGEYKAAVKAGEVGKYLDRCANCGVKTICDLMYGQVSKLGSETEDLINGLITHFENMKVAEN